MVIVCEDFNNLLSSYARTIPNNNLLFRVTKSCGYSQLITVPKHYWHDRDVDIQLLYDQIGLQMGPWAQDKVYFHSKIEIHKCFNNLHTDYWFPLEEKTYIKYVCSIPYHCNLQSFATRALPTAYTVDECQYTVYQLYIDSECHCNIPHSQPMPPPPPPTPEETVNMTITSSTSMNNLDYIV